jgi:hypothetical protein
LTPILYMQTSVASMTIISVGNERSYSALCSEPTAIANSRIGIPVNECKQVLYPLPLVQEFDSCVIMEWVGCQVRYEIVLSYSVAAYFGIAFFVNM